MQQRETAKSMPKKSDTGMIVLTNESCVIMGVPRPGIPTIVWEDGTIEAAAADWLRYLSVRHLRPPSTLLEYAKILRPFLRFCRERGRSWDCVDDDFLILWQQTLLRFKKVQPNRASTSLSIIFQFYLWAQEDGGYLRNYVATNKADRDLGDHIFAISARPSVARRGALLNWTWPYLVSAPATSVGRRHTPTEEEIRDIHTAASRREYWERNCLLYMWAEFAGSRRFEVLQLRRDHLPSRHAIETLRERGGVYKVEVTRKGGKVWNLEAPPDLLDATWDWLEVGWREIVARFKGDPTFKPPAEVFISGKTGRVLSKDSVTKIAKLDFREAGVENASLHRLRARFAVEQVEAEIRELEMNDMKVTAGTSIAETILTRVAAKMGQRHVQSLRPYLNQVLDRRTRIPEAVARQEARASAAIIARQLAPLLERVAQAVDCHEGKADADLAAAAEQLIQKLKDVCSSPSTAD